MTANWLTVSFHSWVVPPELAVMSCKPSQISLVAASLVGKCPLGLDHLAQLRVDVFDGVGGVDDLADSRKEHEERDDAIPGSPSAHRHCRSSSDRRPG